MRKRIPLLVAFFMVLYIGSLISIPTYVSSTILAQPNMTKEFSESAYLDESSYSIDGFSETLEDDVFYTPDGFYDDTPVTASQGYDDWADCLHEDLVNWSITSASGDEYVSFYGDYAIEGFSYAIYGFSYTGEGSFYVYDTMIQDMQFLVNITATEGWFNGTYWGTNYEPKNVYLMGNHSTTYMSIDYIELRFHYLPLLDYSYSGGFTNWGDSFTNVSDWNAIDDPISTDGDLGIFTTSNDLTYDRYDCNTPSGVFEGAYVEYRINPNTTHGTSGKLYIYFMSADDYSGDALQIITHSGWVAGWQTNKVLITASETIESITVYAKAALNTQFQMDYLRISPSDEMGLQHDASTIQGLSSADGGTIETDDDLLTLTADGDGSTFLIVADTTTTASAISTVYYPFFAVNINSGSGSWTLEQYDGSAYATLQSSTAISTGIKRFNMRTLDTYVAWWRITLTANAVLVSDWAKAHSIANFTVTQSAVGTNEYAYVTGGELHFNLDGDSDYILLTHDPTISVDSATYNRWILDIDNVGTGTSHTDDYGIDFYVGAWQGYTYDLTNSTMPTGTTTAFRIISYDAYSLQSIIFWDAHQWHTIDTVTLYFDLPEWHLVESVSIIIWLEILT